jgi:hypothetical protein
MYVRLNGSFDPSPFSTPFGPNFTVCKSEGGSATCPSEYVKEFSGYQRRPGYLGDLSDTWFGDGAEGPVVDEYYLPTEDTSDADAAFRSGVVFRPTVY